MPIYELYSQRKRRAERSGKEDVYRYDSPSSGLLVQLEQIFRDGIGRYWEPQAYSMNSPPNNNEGWIDLRKALAREKKVHYLANVEAPDMDVLSYLTSRSDIDDVLDVVELLCRYVDIVLGSLQPYDRTSRGIEEKPKGVILEVNYRLREDGLRFQYEAKQIVRVDSQFIHSEVVKPALTLLAQSGFSGAQEEFLRAHQLYREGSAKDAITWANKAFESTMKAVCKRKGWDYPNGARASDLVKLLRSKGLWPDYLDNSFDQLMATLSSGLPQVRNNAGGHGQGEVPVETPLYVAAYALHLAAAKIVLLGSAAGATRA